MMVDFLSNSMLDLLDTQIMLTFITLHIYQLLCTMLVIGENLGHCNCWNPKVLFDSHIFCWMNMITINWKNIPFVLTSWTIYQAETKVNNHHKSWYNFPLCQNRFKIIKRIMSSNSFKYSSHFAFTKVITSTYSNWVFQLRSLMLLCIFLSHFVLIEVCSQHVCY
jgi:hypothetical protein